MLGRGRSLLCSVLPGGALHDGRYPSVGSSTISGRCPDLDGGDHFYAAFCRRPTDVALHFRLMIRRGPGSGGEAGGLFWGRDRVKQQYRSDRTYNRLAQATDARRSTAAIATAAQR